MANRSRISICVALLTVAGIASAGGDYVPVEVKSLAVRGNNYELVVAPVRTGDPVYKDPYFGNCQSFTVKGTYSAIRSAVQFPEAVTQKSHTAALAELSSASKEGRTVNFGWVGNGFKPIDPKVPCVVRSRALHRQVESGVTAVLSFHDAV